LKINNGNNLLFVAHPIVRKPQTCGQKLYILTCVSRNNRFKFEQSNLDAITHRLCALLSNFRWVICERTSEIHMPDFSIAGIAYK